MNGQGLQFQGVYELFSLNLDYLGIRLGILFVELAVFAVCSTTDVCQGLMRISVTSWPDSTYVVASRLNAS